MIKFSVEEGVAVTSQGRPVQFLEMKSDETGSPTMVNLGSLTLSVIKRGERYGVRLRDKNSRSRREFKGLSWFPVREDFRVKARFVPHPEPKQLNIINVLGDPVRMTSPGTLIFTINGQKQTLEPVT